MAILFDLDETLLRESDARNRAASDFLKQFSSELPFSESEFLAYWQDLQERHFKRFAQGEITFQEQRRARLHELFSPYESNLTDSELDSRFNLYLTYYESNWALFDDVRPFLDRVRHLRLGIVTNGEGKQQRDKLKKTGILNRFEVIVISEEIGVAKPDPQIFREACRLLSVSPANCIYIGDQVDLDIEGSKSAGMTPIWLNREGTSTLNRAFKIVRSLLEIEI